MDPIIDTLNYMRDHSHYEINNLDDKVVSYTTFKCSIDTAFFITQGHNTQDKINTVMKNIMNSLARYKLKVRENNGTYRKVSGGLTQKKRMREIRFDKLYMAYHNEGVDASIPVNPHIHFIIDKKDRMGKKYIYLKEGLKYYAQKYGLRFHFSSQSNYSGLTKKESKSIVNMSIVLQRGKEKRKLSLIQEDKLDYPLNNLEKHLNNTSNLAYYLKQMTIVNQTLRQLNLDYSFKGVNLRESIPYTLPNHAYYHLLNLEEGLNINLNLNNVFDRELYKYAYGFPSPVIEVTKQHFKMPENLDDCVSIKKDTSSTVTRQIQGNEFIQLVRQDIRQALSTSSNWKDVVTLLEESGYKKASYGKKKVNQYEPIFNHFTLLTRKNKWLKISFLSLGLTIPKILSIFMENRKRKVKRVKRKSLALPYRKEKTIAQAIGTTYTYHVQIPFLLRCNLELNIPSLRRNPLFENFNISVSKMYHMTAIQSKETTIVVSENHIEVKRKGKNENLSDMIIAILGDYFPLPRTTFTLEGNKEDISQFNRTNTKAIEVESLKNKGINVKKKNSNVNRNSRRRS